MATAQVGTLLRHLHALAAGSRRGPDRQLVDDFAARRDESAFAALVARHGPMVLRVCRRVLNHEQDAEDAFQATFLVLARSTGTIRMRETVANWLHGVAFRVAMKARRSRARRRNHEQRLWRTGSVSCRVGSNPAANAAGSPTWDDVQSILDEEIERLPERLREAFLLCVLESKSKAEAAAELCSKEGTVSSRVTRARHLLQQRLARRGVKLGALLAAVAVADGAGKAAVPASLTQLAIRLGLLVTAGKSAAGAVPSHIAALAAGATRAMLLTKTKIAVAALLVSGLLAACGFVLASANDEKKSQASAKQQAATKPQAAEEGPMVEVRGRVLDPDGKPFAGAKLYLHYQNSKETNFPVRATSDADGRFFFTFKRSLLDESSFDTSWFVVLAMGKAYGPDWTYQSKPEAGAVLNLRLVKDVPIGGRILDVNGKPVKDAKLRIEHTESWADTDVFLQSVRDREWARVDSKTWFGPFPRQLSTLTTDAEGHFRLTGVGKDRLVQFQVQGPNIQWGPMRAIAREMKAPVEPRKVRFAEGPVFHPVYPATFDHVFQPSRLIRGVVRDKKTGRPIAGIRVDGYGTTDSATTDAEGRFTLDGFGKSAGGAYGMGVRPPGDRYFSRSVSFPDTPGLGPVEGEIELVSGILVKGRVTHHTTGKPIAGARVEYNPLLPNPFVRWFGPNGAGILPCSWTDTGPDGSYRLVVLPGPGALGFSARSPKETFMPAIVTAQELKDFFKDKEDHGNEDILRIQASENGFSAVGQSQYNQLLLINPGEKDETFTRDAALQPAKPIKGKVVGADGKPFIGATAYNLAPGILSQPLPDDKFTVEGVNPRRVRYLLFIDKDRKHGAFLSLKGEQREPLTVRLEPCGVATGRLLNQDGEPVAEAVARLDANGPYDSAPAKVKTDKQGRFRFEGIVAGQNHQARFGPGPYGQYLYKPFTLKAGESKDLGDEHIKPKQ
jgi:RNA polymerase sigma factor (sigma-70 family)